MKDEKQMYFRNNESLDKVTDILGEVLKREDITEDDRKDIYKLLYQINDIHKESQMQKSKHITSRIITAIGAVGAAAISLGSVLIHEKYKTQREIKK